MSKKMKHIDARAKHVEQAFKKWKQTRDISCWKEHRFDDYPHMIVLSSVYFSIIFHHDELKLYAPSITGVNRNTWDRKSRICRYYCWNCDLERNIALLRNGENIPSKDSINFNF